METLNKVNVRYQYRLAEAFKYKKITGKIQDIRQGARSLTYVVRLTDPFFLDAATAISEQLALACHSPNVITLREAGLITYQIELPKQHWLQYYRGEHVTGLGVGLTDQQESVDYEFNPPHSLIAGTTGSGKTYTAMAILMALMETYTREQLQIVICDPHSDLDVFDNEEHVVRFDWGCISSTTEEIKNAVTFVHSVMLQRIRNKDKDAKKLVLVVDEAEAVVGTDKDTLRMLVDIGNQARKYGVHLIITSKKPTQKTLPDLLNALSNRWVGKTSMDKGSVTRLLGQSIDTGALTEQGDFLHVDARATVRFLVATINNRDYDRLIRAETPQVLVPERKVVTMPVDNEVRDKPFFIGTEKTDWDPEVFAAYVGKFNAISIAEAKRDFGHGRIVHNRYKDAAKQFARELLVINPRLLRALSPTK